MSGERSTSNASRVKIVMLWYKRMRAMLSCVARISVSEAYVLGAVLQGDYIEFKLHIQKYG